MILVLYNVNIINLGNLNLGDKNLWLVFNLNLENIIIIINRVYKLYDWIWKESEKSEEKKDLIMRLFFIS